MSRPAKVIIHLSALRHNLNQVNQLAPDSRVMAIVKADAYGHGIVRVAKELSKVDAFGVACMEEAIILREAGIDKTILLLEGMYSGNELERISRYHFDIVVHDIGQIAMLESASVPAPVNVWMKIDTGMHRLGFLPEMFDEAYQRLCDIPHVNKPLKLMTHLATANERDPELTFQQIRCLNELTSEMPLEKTIANSASVLSIEESHCDWVRPGLMLYGISPFADTTGADHNLKPAMTLQSKLISVKQLKTGDPVGYGASWCCPENMPIGIVAAGYGDGYPRHAASGTPVLVNGTQVSLVGRASMDMLAVDLRNEPNAKVGDPVVLWGNDLPVEEIAKSANTIPYQLVCAVHKRLDFVEDG